MCRGLQAPLDLGGGDSDLLTRKKNYVSVEIKVQSPQIAGKMLKFDNSHI